MSKETVLYMIIPCYNEQEIFAYSSNNLKHKLEQLMEQSKISPLSKVCFVNDGSTDATWKLIQKACKEDEIFSGICLSHNEGHQNAVLAGLMTVRPYADIAISMDADLQDDIEAIDQMVDKYDEGYDIVYGVRNSRKKDR